jgi:predicted RNase H-like HicB family nuclease
MNQTITIHVQHFDNVPEQNYVAHVEGMKGMVVSGNSIGECVQEIGISMIVMERYERQQLLKNFKYR